MMVEATLLGVVDTVRCAADVLWNCVPATCVISLTSVTQKVKNKIKCLLSNPVIPLLATYTKVVI